MRTPSRPALAVLAALAGSAACSGKPEGSVDVVLGEETDTLTRAPAPGTLVVAAIDLDRKVKELARSPLPASTIDLGDAIRSDVAAVRVTGLASDGAEVVKGETLYVQWGALELATLPVLVQRAGETARMPAGPPAFTATQATLVAGRYVLGASGTATSLYDLLLLRALSAPPVLPRPARSLATHGAIALVVDEAGASAVDLETGRSSDVEPPQGGTFAEVAGGATVLANDGSAYIVGATREAGGATTRILRLSSDGNVTFVALGSPREGACAAWVEGRGLVVWGGSAAAPGGELLAPGANVAALLPFAPDPVRGCGAAALDPSHVLVAGGTGSATTARVIDLACAGTCAPLAWPGEVPLARAAASPLAPDAALVLGDDAATGATRALRAGAAGIREVPLRLPRRGARLVASPVPGAAVVFGGGAGVEQYLE